MISTPKLSFGEFQNAQPGSLIVLNQRGQTIFGLVTQPYKDEQYPAVINLADFRRLTVGIDNIALNSSFVALPDVRANVRDVPKSCRISSNDAPPPGSLTVCDDGFAIHIRGMDKSRFALGDGRDLGAASAGTYFYEWSIEALDATTGLWSELKKVSAEQA